jgi:hypothetical protein
MFTAIMDTSGTGCTKRQDFDLKSEADAHILAHPQFAQAYVVPTPSFPQWRWVCDPIAKTVTDRGPLTQAELDAIDDADSNERMGKLEIKGIHENRLRTLESRPTITADDLKAWVKDRL